MAVTATIYNRFLENWAKGLIDFDSVSFYGMLCSESYVPNEDAHDFRDDVTNEITGIGYTAGGAASTVTVTRDDANNRLDVTFGAINWAAATITARKIVYYQRRGGAASADELVMCVDYGANASSVADTFTANANVLRISKT